jgi:hypothetical protein
VHAALSIAGVGKASESFTSSFVQRISLTFILSPSPQGLRTFIFCCKRGFSGLLEWPQTWQAMSIKVSTLQLGDFAGSSLSDQARGCGSSHYPPEIAQICCKAKKRCQLSRDRWEDLKPFIRRVYIEDGKTLQQLAGILRDKQDFYPT